MHRKKAHRDNLIVSLAAKSKQKDIGNKAANLQRLAKLGMRVPDGCVLRWDAHRRYIEDDPSVAEQVMRELEEKLDPTRCYAVRSSANIEDSFDHSFAGQFKTVLNVQGIRALVQAVREVWESARIPDVETYLCKRSLEAADLHMAVLLQEMVQPAVSGVAFSRNPLTGLHETVVEAVMGQGTALVQEGVTPYRWTYSQGGFTSQPEDTEIPLSLIQQVVDGTQRVCRRLGRDVDMEWVYDGQNLFWVQMREITSLRRVEVYSNRLSREMLAGIIKPLIWSINIPLVGGVVVKVITDLIGPNDLTAERLVRSFYYRAYFNMGLLGTVFEKLGIPPDALEVMWGINETESNGKKGARHGMKMPMTWQMLGLTPRILRFAWDKWTLPARLEPRLNAIEATFRSVDIKAAEQLSPEELIAAVDRLYAVNTEAVYYNKIVPLTMYIYNSVLRKQMARIGVDFAQLDMLHNQQDYDRYNPNYQLGELHRQFMDLPSDTRERLQHASYQDVISGSGFRLDGFASGLQSLMRNFGHLCDNGNDFSAIPWRESGDTILKLIMNLAGRPGAEAESAKKKLRFEDLHLSWPRRWLLGGLYQKARKFTLYREQTSYIYTLGYGLFRVYFLALARHLVNRGWLDVVDDIFYLEMQEVRQVVSGDLPPEEIQARVAARKSEIERMRDVALPTVIFGRQPPPIEVTQARKLTGTPTSRGYCTAPVRVVNGLHDFNKVQPGDILAIPFSDVGWAPLFARAGGIIAESGGLLSHSSIVAREYGIPAIVSVAGATSLPDGKLISMDGYKGEVYILEENEKGEEEIASPERK